MALSAQDWLQRIHALPLPSRVKIMNVCGGHERSITMAGNQFDVIRQRAAQTGHGNGALVTAAHVHDFYA